MKLEIDTVEINGFMAFAKGEHVWQLSKCGSGLHFLCGRNEYAPRMGPNGTGKSSLINALSWCWFGKTPDGRRTPDLSSWQVPGSSGAKSMRVATFIRCDGAIHIIERSTGPNRLAIDGKEVAPEHVTTLLGFNHPVCSHTMIMGQGRSLFFDLDAKAKMELFSDVLRLDRWDARAHTASRKATELLSDQSDYQSDLAADKASLAEIDSMADELKARSAQWQLEWQRKLDGFEANLKELRTSQTKAEDHYNTASLTYDGAQTELIAIHSQVDVISDKVAGMRNQHRDFQSKMAVARNAYDTAVRTLDRLGQEDTCPQCGQSIKGTQLARHKAELESTVKKHVMVLALEDTFQDKIDQQEKLTSNLRTVAAQFRGKSDDARVDMDFWGTKNTELKTSIRHMVNSRKQIETEQNPYSEQIQTLRRKRSKLEASVRELETYLTKLSARIERTKFWVKGFKEVRLYIIEEVLQELELATNAMLDDVGLVNWNVQYAIEKETKSGTVQRGLNVMIQSPGMDKAVRWECWSGGEGQRLRVIGALALAEVLLNHAGVETNLEILDEPTQHMSPEGVQDLCAFLSSRAIQLDKQTWYVDHQARDSHHFTSVLTAVKTNKGVHLECH